jgi:hypothetical protein
MVIESQRPILASATNAVTSYQLDHESRKRIEPMNITALSITSGDFLNVCFQRDERRTTNEF